MPCDIREPYVLKAMGQACSQVAASKGYLGENDRHDIADRIIAGVSAGETSVEKLVSLAVVHLDRSH
jgi:hypothetical protein